jgi:TolA-binding protein
MSRAAVFLVAAVTMVFSRAELQAQTFRRGGVEFDCRRVVQLTAAEAKAQIVTTEFFTHGKLAADGRNLVVCGRGQQIVPYRVLQVGPGDFCRVAFQVAPGQEIYEIFYGGPAPTQPPPPWTATEGLVLETRRWKDCNLNDLASVRAAFASAKPIGADFVPTVFDRYDPFDPTPTPFLSRYQGTLQIAAAGNYAFYTSSQDCSFLLIDGKEVVTHPGIHAPVGQARLKGEVSLTAGPHQFEYVHAASGGAACMIAGWLPPGDAKPVGIPPEAFRHGAIARAPIQPPQLRSKKVIPDFTRQVIGDVPLPDSEQALIGVQFKDLSPAAATAQAKIEWDFGDGQTSDQPGPLHVYLRSGLYTVKLSARRGSRSVEATNRIQIDRPVVLDAAKAPQMATFLPVLAKYDPAKCEGPALLQLVRAFEFAGKLPAAASAGKAAFGPEAAARDDDSLRAVALMVGPMLRIALDDPQGALDVWKAAAGKIGRAEWKAECETEAADVALNDLLLPPAQAKPILDAAAGRLPQNPTGPAAAALHRVRGDWHARAGDGKAAREAYAKAQAALGGVRNSIQQNAWRGAHSRSTEEFLRKRDFVQARDELDRWQREFPADKIEGYLPLLYARYWALRAKYTQAIALADALVAVNPASPYADQLLYLAAGCEEKLGRIDRAKATLQSLLTDYRGSPLVESAKKQLARLEAGGDPTKKRPASKEG